MVSNQKIKLKFKDLNVLRIFFAKSEDKEMSGLLINSLILQK